jgi:deoxyribodipyrimidine photo-lyase
VEQKLSAPIIVWFRQDLRLRDNPALCAAAATGRPVIPLYVLDDETPAQWRLGGASRWWLHHSLSSLTRDLARRQSSLCPKLILRSGNAAEIVTAFAAETHAHGVYWNRCYEAYAVHRDRTIKEALLRAGVEARSFNASLLFEPWEVKTGSGTPFRVFTAFWRACARLPATPPLPPPQQLEGLGDASPASDDLAPWKLLPRPDWAAGLRETWAPGETQARKRVRDFLENAIAGYRTARDLPGVEGTSRLSPHLHFGEIGPRQIRHAIESHVDAKGGEADTETFLKELGWREFSYHLLFHYPDLPERPLRPEFADFPWRDDEAGLRAWQRGQTGYPIVDAGMRELWATGWMHNRVRMIVASFLVKDMMLPWQMGEAWFWDTLVDADLANNAASWQWVSGSGADAAPYFRIFNPVLQGERFDADGTYIRHWIPELAKLPAAALHAPWKASPEVLAKAGLALGRDYPMPILDHAAARERALAAYAASRRA